MNKISLSVLVPVYNEEYLVEESLNRLFVLEESPYLENVQVIVVNDCSTDNTGKILKRLASELPGKSRLLEWRFINHEENVGKGGAIQTALERATNEISVVHDSDLEYYPKDILRMIPLFVEREADAVYGSRFAVHEYRRVLMFRHQLGNKFLTLLTNLVSNLNLTDMETCYKAVRTGLLKSIPIRSNDYRIEPEITIKLARRNARIYEIPINYSGRTYQEGKKIDWRDGFKAIWAILTFGFSDDVFVEDEYGSRILSRLSRADKLNSWMADTIRPYVGQNVLEIGSGMGNITRKLIPRTTYHATDINPFYLEFMNRIKADKPYLSVSYLDLNHVSGLERERRQFDTVICLNVIEHLDDDHMAMKNISNLLHDDGRAIILVPRGQWIFGSLDEVLGHRRRYSEKALKAIAEKVGLEVSEIIPFNRVSTLPWIFNGKILRRRTFGLFQIYMMNLLVPLFRRIDRFLPLPSLSLVAILRK
ncbi:MAG: glycosyltransferase [Thermodesulfobacteriota bacterium]|nr:glycosyltransferase [Thermodesulfobacteriota bacterium]